METLIVVLQESTPNEQLLNVAKRYATGNECKILLCRIIDRDEYQKDVRQKAESSKQFESIDAVESDAEAKAKQIGSEYFGEEITYTPLGIVGTVPEDVLELAETHDSDHVFIAGKKRSPAGKVLFGDSAQKLILDFDGAVTIVTEDV